MNRGEQWFTKTENEQKEIRVLRQVNKFLARALNKKPIESLSNEQKQFIIVHLPVPGSKCRSIRKSNKKSKVFNVEKYTILRDEKLKELSNKIMEANTLISIDVEQHEHSKKITEVGVSIFCAKTGKFQTTFHYIIKENYNKRNGTRVPDHKNNFNFGTSIHLSLRELSKVLSSHIDSDCYIIGHAFSNDVEMLKEYIRFKNNQVLDTQYFAKYYFSQNRLFSLKTLLENFEIEHSYLHNAGNDAYYTMKCLLAMKDLYNV